MVELEANMKENQNWATFDDNEKDEFWKRSELERDKDLRTDKKIHENGFENEACFVASPIEKDLCTDEKNVMECEFPEFEVCYRENHIKDICVDDGVPSKEMILTPEVKIELEVESLASEDFEYLPKNDYDGVIGNSNEVNHSESCEILDEELRQKLVEDDKRALGKSIEIKSLKALFDSRSSDSSDVEHLSDQIKHDKTISKSPASASPDDGSNKGISNLSYNSKTDSGTITFDFNSIKLESESIDESTNNNNKTHELSLKRNGLPTNSNKISNNLTDENKGESSFSMAGPVSGIISHSGSIPYSGSISIRSDSSTTSARSFAFPILPNEWNSSPVRMAKADRRRYRSAKSWRNGLFCCRF